MSVLLTFQASHTMSFVAKKVVAVFAGGYRKNLAKKLSKYGLICSDNLSKLYLMLISGLTVDDILFENDDTHLALSRIDPSLVEERSI